MKTILFPTDFSAAAARAYIYALHLARKLNASIITLHAFEKPDVSGLAHIPKTLEDFYNTIDLYEFENYKTAIPQLAKIQEEHGFGDVDVNHTIHEGPTKEVIIQRAKAEDAALIVMGTTGARGLKEIILGSVTGEVMENASCPVLAVPEQAVFDGVIDNIGFTVSFKEEEVSGLRKVEEIFRNFEPEIHCVNVDLAHTNDITGRMDTFAEQFEDREKFFFHTIDGTAINPLLTQFLENKKIDILAMVTHKRSFFEELFHYSRTKAMSYHSNTPILSLACDHLA